MSRRGDNKPIGSLTATGLSADLSQFSLSFWCRVEPGSTMPGLSYWFLARLQNDSVGNLFEIAWGAPFFAVSGALIHRSVTTGVAAFGVGPCPFDGNWHHVSVTVDTIADQVSWIVDGVSAGTVAGGGAGDVLAQLHECNSFVFYSDWITSDVAVCEFGLWDRVLTPVEISHLYSDKWTPSLIETGLIDSWRVLGTDDPEPSSGDGVSLAVTDMTPTDHVPGILLEVPVPDDPYESPYEPPSPPPVTETLIEFVSTDSLATSVGEINPNHILNLADLGYIKGGETEYFAFRLANRSYSEISYSLICEDDQVSFVPSRTGVIASRGLTDTISLKITLPQSAESKLVETDVIASTGIDYDVLRLYYGAVGAMEEHTAFTSDEEFGDNSETFDAITTWGQDIIRLYTFQPVEYTTPDDSTRMIQVDPSGYNKIVSCHSHCERLNPMNTECGYSRSWAIVGCVFSEEEIIENSGFSVDDTTGVYDHFANLYIPPSYALNDKWGRFEYADSLQPEQCKKTVRVFKRLGRLFHVAEIELLKYQRDAAQYQARCREVHIPSPHARTFTNPFAMTYERYSHKPYQVYQCWEGLKDLFNYIPETGGSGSGSGSLSGS